MKYALLITCTVLLSVGAGCARTSQSSSQTTTVKVPRGVSISPDVQAAQPFADFFQRSPEAGSFVSWAGPVTDLGKSQSAPRVLLDQTDEHHQTPIIIVSPSSTDIRSETAWESWSTPVLTFAQEQHIPYLGIGNELNKTLSSTDFKKYADHFTELVQKIHRVSPNTKVFPILQYEWLSGNRGGLFGGKNDDRQAQWSILENLGSADLIAFTSYPGLIYRTPTAIPTSYYSQIREHTTADIAFTEIGWARSGPKGWESSVAIQAQFVDRFFSLTQTLDQQFTLWAFLFDPQAKEPFSSMGLLSAGQSTSPTWEAWTKR